LIGTGYRDPWDADARDEIEQEYARPSRAEAEMDMLPLHVLRRQHDHDVELALKDTTERGSACACLAERAASTFRGLVEALYRIQAEHPGGVGWMQSETDHINFVNANNNEGNQP
jgi:hypothetical protein